MRVFCFEDLAEYFLSPRPLLVQNVEEALIPFVVRFFTLNNVPLDGIQNLPLHQLVENGFQDLW